MLLMAGSWAPGLLQLFGGAFLGAVAVILGVALGCLF